MQLTGSIELDQSSGPGEGRVRDFWEIGPEPFFCYGAEHRVWVKWSLSASTLGLWAVSRMGNNFLFLRSPPLARRLLT